ncbi:MAG: pectate lyase [Firmicutes bacterium]|nr:pectate lyase [Bacillota bacterium]
MQRKIGRWAVLTCLMLVVSLSGSLWGQHLAAQVPTIKWENCLNQSFFWYKSEEAIRIADNVLLYQRNTGGWPKNIDMAEVLDELDKEDLLFLKDNRGDSTFDNGATITQMRYLARVYMSTQLERFKEGFIKGLEYILEAQYDKGGWPQYYPLRSGYYSHITFNDNAMVNILTLLQEIADPKNYNFAFVGEEYRKQAAEAVAKGIECILACQIKVEGKLTAWCAQHYADTLEPAPARAYEHPSLSGWESVGIVRFLMSLDQPSPEIITSIQAAVAWFNEAKLTGITVAKSSNDVVVIENPNAPPIWARFYEIGTNRPIFSGRDGIIKYSLAEIERERRTGYSWYTNAPATLLSTDYPQWQQKWAPENNVLNK